MFCTPRRPMLTRHDLRSLLAESYFTHNGRYLALVKVNLYWKQIDFRPGRFTAGMSNPQGEWTHTVHTVPDNSNRGWSINLRILALPSSFFLSTYVARHADTNAAEGNCARPRLTGSRFMAHESYKAAFAWTG